MTYEPLAKLAHDAAADKRPGALKAALLADSKMLAACIEHGWFREVIAEIEREEQR